MSRSDHPFRSRALFLVLSVIVLLPLAVGSLSRAFAQPESEGSDSLYRHLSVFTEVLSLIQRSYVDETPLEDLFLGAFEGTTDALDPLATYVPAHATERYREALSVGSARSGVTVGKDSGIAFVIGVEAGSPGEAAGLEPGDVLAKVGERSTREIPLWELEVLLAGESTSLELGLLRRGQSITTSLELGEFDRGESHSDLQRGVPVVRIVKFDPETAARVEHLVREEAIVDAGKLVVDLRGVAGGSEEGAFEVASLFRRGQLGELRSRTGVERSFTSEEEPRWQGSIALLTDGGTQGASEVFVAALKDLSTVQVVGTQTFGHAGRRASRSTAGGATLFFTDAFFAGPEGELLDRGVEPDIVVRPERQLLLGEDEVEGDPVLDRALEVLLDEPKMLEAA